jgi:hypothetical protein
MAYPAEFAGKFNVEIAQCGWTAAHAYTPEDGIPQYAGM